jgi:hypothetical protein
MSGAKAQLFIHEKTPHVFPIFDFPEIKVFTESWTEIRRFILDIDQGDQVSSKAEIVHWDGSRTEIADSEYITMSPDEVVPKSTRLIKVTGKNETEHPISDEPLSRVYESKSKSRLYPPCTLEINV